MDLFPRGRCRGSPPAPVQLAATTAGFVWDKSTQETRIRHRCQPSNQDYNLASELTTQWEKTNSKSLHPIQSRTYASCILKHSEVPKDQQRLDAPLPLGNLYIRFFSSKG